MHIFEIIEGEVDLKIKDKTWKLVDPPFHKKVMLQKEVNSLMEFKEKLSGDEYLLKFHEINKKQILMFIPSMTEEYLDSMGDSMFSFLLKTITEAAELNFGAKVEKKEELEEKKSL